jgi:hypothetical protein
VIGGTSEAVELLRSRDLTILAGAVGYWAFDNAVLWATLEAVGANVPISIVLMGYLIGQLGGLLPLPGGVGGIDGGLIVPERGRLGWQYASFRARPPTRASTSDPACTWKGGPASKSAAACTWA